TQSRALTYKPNSYMSSQGATQSRALTYKPNSYMSSQGKTQSRALTYKPNIYYGESGYDLKSRPDLQTQKLLLTRANRL
ncbi:MAG: hypothetical protein RBR28_11005, partial [Lentimicrobium sp.]|nr:hypothetical protein [Lentimicrobium sp.]